MSTVLPADYAAVCTYWDADTGDCDEMAVRRLSGEEYYTLSPRLNRGTGWCIQSLCGEHLAKMEALLAVIAEPGAVTAISPPVGSAVPTDLLARVTMDAKAQLAQGRVRARMVHLDQPSRDRAADAFENDWRRNWPGLAAAVDHAKGTN